MLLFLCSWALNSHRRCTYMGEQLRTNNIRCIKFATELRSWLSPSLSTSRLVVCGSWRGPISAGRGRRVSRARGVLRAGGEGHHRSHRPNLHSDSDRRDLGPAPELLHHRCQPGARTSAARLLRSGSVSVGHLPSGIALPFVLVVRR